MSGLIKARTVQYPDPVACYFQHNHSNFHAVGDWTLFLIIDRAKLL